MKKLVLGAVVAVTLAGGLATPSIAAPPSPGPIGAKCSFNSTTDVTRESGWQTGAIKAGPLVTSASGTLHCKVRVGSDVHNTTAAVDQTATAVNGVVVMEPRTIDYPATAAQDVSLCTSWDPDGSAPTQYWVSQPAPQQGFWTTDSSAHCGVALSIEPNDPECSIWLAIDSRVGTNIAEVWQDCEGYSPII